MLDHAHTLTYIERTKSYSRTCLPSILRKTRTSMSRWLGPVFVAWGLRTLIYTTKKLIPILKDDFSIIRKLYLHTKLKHRKNNCNKLWNIGSVWFILVFYSPITTMCQHNCKVNSVGKKVYTKCISKVFHIFIYD